MAEKAEKGRTAFYLTKSDRKVFRPGKTAKEKKNGKHARHLVNLSVRAEQSRRSK